MGIRFKTPAATAIILAACLTAAASQTRWSSTDGIVKPGYATGEGLSAVSSQKAKAKRGRGAKSGRKTGSRKTNGKSKGKNVGSRKTTNVRTNVNKRTNVNRRTNVNVNRRTNVVVRRPVRTWVRRPYYGTVVAGVALGTIVTAAAVGVAPEPPGPNMCWFWNDDANTQGYWDYCNPP